jgi:hypothetical protein
LHEVLFVTGWYLPLGQYSHVLEARNFPGEQAEAWIAQIAQIAKTRD